MESLPILGAIGLIIGIYGLLRPESGRVWGSPRYVQNNTEEAIEESAELNQMVSKLIILISSLMLIYPLINGRI